MRSLLVALIVGALLAAGALALASGQPPVDRGYPPPGVTAIGFASAPVDATNRSSEGRIRRAVAAANEAGAAARVRRRAAQGAGAGRDRGHAPRRGLGGRPGPESSPTTAAGVVAGHVRRQRLLRPAPRPDRLQDAPERPARAPAYRTAPPSARRPKDVTVYLTVTFAPGRLG